MLVLKGHHKGTNHFGVIIRLHFARFIETPAGLLFSSRRQIDALVEAVDIKADGVTFASFCSFLEHSELDVKAVLHALEA